MMTADSEAARQGWTNVPASPSIHLVSFGDPPNFSDEGSVGSCPTLIRQGSFRQDFSIL